MVLPRQTTSVTFKSYVKMWEEIIAKKNKGKTVKSAVAFVSPISLLFLFPFPSYFEYVDYSFSIHLITAILTLPNPGLSYSPRVTLGTWNAQKWDKTDCQWLKSPENPTLWLLFCLFPDLSPTFIKRSLPTELDLVNVYWAAVRKSTKYCEIIKGKYVILWRMC